MVRPTEQLFVSDSIFSHVLIGCIINVSSLMATKMGAGAAVYAASKAGVVGMFMIYP